MASGLYRTLSALNHLDRAEKGKKDSESEPPAGVICAEDANKRHTGLLCYVAKANKTQQGPILTPSGSINQPLGAGGGGTLVLIVSCLTWLFKQQSFFRFG